jgi:hypothetical protein
MEPTEVWPELPNYHHHGIHHFIRGRVAIRARTAYRLNEHPSLAILLEAHKREQPRFGVFIERATAQATLRRRSARSPGLQRGGDALQLDVRKLVTRVGQGGQCRDLETMYHVERGVVLAHGPPPIARNKDACIPSARPSSIDNIANAATARYTPSSFPRPFSSPEPLAAMPLDAGGHESAMAALMVTHLVYAVLAIVVAANAVVAVAAISKIEEPRDGQ